MLKSVIAEYFLLLLLLTSCGGSQSGKEGERWIKPDSVAATLEEALERPEEIRQLTLRNRLPSGAKIEAVKLIDERIGRLGNLRKLQILGLEQNSIPIEPGSLKELRILEIKGWGDSFELENTLFLRGLPKLELLILEGCGLKELPEIPQTVRVLDLSGNAIQNIDGSLSATELKKLDLSENGLRYIHIRNAKEMKELRRLDLSANDLKESPDFLNNLPALQSLSLSNNPMYRLELKESAGTSLELLELVNIPADSLPEWMLKSGRLQHLLVGMPLNEGQKERLKELDSLQLLFFDHSYKE